MKVSSVGRKDVGVACSICYMDFKMGKGVTDSGEKTMKLHCGHKFHPACVTKWFEKSQICPNCRAEMK